MLTDKCSAFIRSQVSTQLQVPHSDKTPQREVNVVDDDVSDRSGQSGSPDLWIMINKTILYQADKEVLLSKHE